MIIVCNKTTKDAMLINISDVDADLDQFAWSFQDKNRKYIIHITNPYSALYFGVKPKTKIYLHRVILSRMLGLSLTELSYRDIMVDHINGNTYNNNRDNIRVGNLSQSNCNRRFGNSSGYQGVQPLPSGKFAATIQKDKVRYHIGTYATALDAKIARDAFGKVLHERYYYSA